MTSVAFPTSQQRVKVENSILLSKGCPQARLMFAEAKRRPTERDGGRESAKPRRAFS